MAITISSKGYGGDVNKSVNYGSSIPLFSVIAVIVFVTTIILWLTLFAINFSLKNQKTDLEARRTELQLEKSNLKQEESRLLDAQRRVFQIKELLDKHPNGRLIFDALNSRTRGDVNFTAAEADLQGSTLELTGQAKDFQALAAQILAFERDDQNRFRSVAVKNIRRDITLGEVGAVSFSISLGFDSAILVNK